MAKFVCTKCKKEYPLDTKEFQCSCSGLFKLEHEIPDFDLKLVDKSLNSLFRYRAFMPLDNSLYKQVSLKEGCTPIVELGPSLYAKLDYLMPTLSFKDRGAATLLWLCKTIGVDKVVEDSSGNAGNSVAAYCAKAKINCEIHVPKGTSEAKIQMLRMFGAEVVVFEGTRDECALNCRKRAKEPDFYYASHVFNPFFYEGTKTYIYEIYEELGKLPDNIFIPVGNGTLLLGCELAIKHLLKSGCISKAPKLYLVQGENCAPLYKGVEKIQALPTLAEGIAIGQPMRAREILDSDYPGEREFVLCKEEDIMPAQRELANLGYFVEPTTAAIYAALRNTKTEGTSIFSLCGSGLKALH